ncbi:hypothetical protein RirG_011440 [Rhizophagus irregularis DAOM 197198w]|uniref:Uncharacterized protein n=1 Tax=Rhizophagus irregularis (strain DAOM 197198w) TaxID=1432141 RepID=A0A015KGR2_RHIIW|nr:hypothetical protein RirG_011440 [Rhizophagus irregularis DAOM 197198w]
MGARSAVSYRVDPHRTKATEARHEEVARGLGTLEVPALGRQASRGRRRVVCVAAGGQATTAALLGRPQD